MLTFSETVLVASFTLIMLPSLMLISLIIVDDLISKVHRWQGLK